MILMGFMIFGIESRAEVNYENPNGKNGFYTIAPEILIEHQDEGITRYRLEGMHGEVITGRIDAITGSVVIKKEAIEEGKSTLDVWNEDENGNVKEGSMKTLQFQVDKSVPLCKIQFMDEEKIEVIAEDNYSGIDEIFYSIEGKEFQSVKGERAFITLPEKFFGKICAYATDKAGNKGEYAYYEIVKKQEPIEETKPNKETEIKDIEAPNIVLSGIEDFMISRETVSYECVITDNIKVTSLSGEIIYKNESNEENRYEITEWKKTGDGYQLQEEFIESGVYQLHISATDKAGNTQKIHKQIIVDLTPPIILGVEKWDGKQLSKFQWDYRNEEIVQDLTSVTYEVRLDGILYTSGDINTSIGNHTLEISARDLAGNESRETIYFSIHKQPVEINEEIEESLVTVSEEEKEKEIQIPERVKEIPTEMKKEVIDIKENKKSSTPIVIGSVSLAVLVGILIYVFMKKKTP